MNKSYQLVILLSMTAMMFSMPNVSAEKINCPENADLEKYPICKYEEQWNESEEFNEKLIEELAHHQKQINEDPSKFAEIYQMVHDKVNSEHPGLQEKCKQLKAWIYEQLGN